MAKPRILVIGNSNIGLSFRIPRMPAANETVVSHEKYAFVPSGHGVIRALCCARLGADTVFCSRLGADAYGNVIRKYLENEGIDLRYARQDKNAQTGFYASFESKTDKRTVSFPAANSLICSDDVEEALTSYPDAMVIGFDTNVGVVTSAISQAKSGNVPVFLDPSPLSPEIPLSAIGKLEAFCPSAEDAFSLTGIRPVGTDNCLRIAIDLYNRLNTKYIIIRLGERGAYVYDGKHSEAVGPFEVNTVDNGGAEDAFSAALCYEYIRNGKNMIAACRYANAVSAYVASKEGEAQAIPTKEKMLDFIKKYEQ